MKVPYIDLISQHQALKPEILQALDELLSRCDFILGASVVSFESAFANYCGTKYAVGCASGTDALVLSMKALDIGPGDEVITVPNSFLGTVAGIILVGAKPVLVDVGADYNINPALIKAVLSPNTKAIIPVHLTGRPAQMDAILKIASEYQLAVIEDAAQAAGAEWQGKKVGSLGTAGCFSLHPLKTMNACGDGGVITTSDEAIYQRLCRLRNHGLKNRDECESWGYNSRLDTLQAAIAEIKLSHLQGWNEKRRENAAYYQDHLAGVVELPLDTHGYAVYHTFVIMAERRDALKQYLEDHGVETKVHYPIPIHLQEAAKDLGYKRGDFPICEHQVESILSLPIHENLSEGQRAHVVKTIKEFYSA